MTPTPTCRKCGSADVGVSYHRSGCGRPACRCAVCPGDAKERRHDEHLHYSCLRCGFDWTGDTTVRDALRSAYTVLAPAAGPERPALQGPLSREGGGEGNEPRTDAPAHSDGAAALDALAARVSAGGVYPEPETAA